MSTATDQAQSALTSLEDKGKTLIAKRSEHNAAQKDFEDAQTEVDAAIEAIKAEKQTLVDGAKSA